MRTLAECEELIRKYPPYDIFNDKYIVASNGLTHDELLKKLTI